MEVNSCRIKVHVYEIQSFLRGKYSFWSSTSMKPIIEARSLNLEYNFLYPRSSKCLVALESSIINHPINIRFFLKVNYNVLKTWVGGG